MFGLITLPLVINYALMGWAKKPKSSKCWWGQCVLLMRAIFRMCGNESQPGLQLVEKLVTPLAFSEKGLGCRRKIFWKTFFQVKALKMSSILRSFYWTGITSNTFFPHTNVELLIKITEFMIDSWEINLATGLHKMWNNCLARTSKNLTTDNC